MEQKFWLTDAVIEGRSTAGELAKQFSLPRRLLHRLVSHARKNTTMKGSNGRPTALDEISKADIERRIESADPASLDAASIKELVKSEELRTAKRRRAEFTRSLMSKRSLKRYIDQFMAYKLSVHAQGNPGVPAERTLSPAVHAPTDSDSSEDDEPTAHTEHT